MSIMYNTDPRDQDPAASLERVPGNLRSMLFDLLDWEGHRTSDSPKIAKRKRGRMVRSLLRDIARSVCGRTLCDI